MFFIILAIFAPLISPYAFDQYKTTEGVRFIKQAAPSAQHLFGTNVMSTDVLSRVIYGARTAIEVTVLSLILRSRSGFRSDSSLAFTEASSTACSC